ncbi:MAG TPA: hypothetical protein VES19_17555 [Candidatus Limnocylindrales bacterium]|nr:hypothetical protein [Candidatus Limnocylindrales bacterium]
MSFLRRILGGSGKPAETSETSEAGVEPVDATSVVDAEIAREREILLAEARRLDDDLIQRQMRYADRAWTPPAQGGTRRADDEDESTEG